MKSRYEKSKVIPVIKADAYSLGAPQIANALLPHVDMLAVATLAEAIRLKPSLSAQKPILILQGFLNRDELQKIISLGFVPTIHSDYQVHMLDGIHLPKVFLKVNTGLNRLGLSPSQTIDFFPMIQKSVDYIVLMTHFHTGLNLESSRHQSDILLSLRSLLGEKLETSISASDGIASGFFSDWLRPGLLMYGIDNPSDQDYRLVPSLSSKIIHIKSLAEGETLGYNATWRASSTTRVAIVLGGYADGILRSLSNRGKVFVNGKFADIIGNVSMDLFAINISDISANVGDEVEIFGEHQRIEDTAMSAGTIAYEVLTSLGSQRIQKIYI